ncbi:hypothetical protein HUU05_22730 [candidate division KSB1 bacterium]|nr:hypothetical protein [candidate division KSB1 bacterium]
MPTLQHFHRKSMIMIRALCCRRLLCMSATLLSTAAFAQGRLNIVDATATVAPTQTEEDTATAAVKISTPDTLRTRYHARLDAGYHTPRVHPYFRDEYRVINDVRRLVLFIDPFALVGLESMTEMLGIVRRFPEHKQTEMIRVAVGGSVVNQVSEMVSRELRRGKLNFVQWQLEKVVLHRAFRYFNVHAHDGVNAQGITLSVPKLKLSYTNQATKHYAYEGFHYSFTSRLGFAYGWSKGDAVYGPRFNLPVGNLGVTYDTKYNVVLSSYEFRRSMSIILRMIYVNYLEIPNVDFWRGEVMLRW